MQVESTNISDAVEYWFDLLENDILKPYEKLSMEWIKSFTFLIIGQSYESKVFWQTSDSRNGSDAIKMDQ